MTPEELTDVLAFVGRTQRRLSVLRVGPDDLVSIESHPEFTRYDGESLIGGPYGSLLTVNVFLDVSLPSRCVGIVAVGMTPGRYSLEVCLDLGPPVRIRPEPINPKMATYAERFRARMADLRAHVAFDKHKSIGIEMDGTSDEKGFVQIWRVVCYECSVSQPRKWEFHEDEVAAVGRPDLLDRFGWGAEIESIKLEPPKERPLAWARLLSGGIDVEGE